MAEMIHTDIFLMGGWSSGLPAATGAVEMGADTVLIERAKLVKIRIQAMGMRQREES